MEPETSRKKDVIAEK